MSARHRVLVVGVGSIGERHLRCLLASGRADVCFAEPNPRLRETIAERYPSARGFESRQTAAAEMKVTSAVIATPAPLHVPLATELANEGVHVLIEKPLAVVDEGVAELRDLIQVRGVVAGVAYVYRSNPILAAMRNAIVSGRFGRPLELIAVAGQSFATYRPGYRDTYYAHRESGGGAVQDALTHLLDSGQWLAGEIQSVVADAAHLKISGVDVEDTVHVLARQGSGILATYSLNQHQVPNELTLTVVCENGTARFENHQSRWRSQQKPDEGWTDHDTVTLERDTLFRLQADAFLDAVEGKSVVRCSLDEAIGTLRATRAILKSIESHSWCSA